MRHTMTKLAVIAFFPGVSVSLPVIAADSMGGDELKKLVVGSTVYLTAQSGKEMKNYFDPDGTLVRSLDGKVIKGSYSIGDDGTQCIKVGKADNCARVVNNGDGTYSRVSTEGKVLGKWNMIVNVKDIP